MTNLYKTPESNLDNSNIIDKHNFEIYKISAISIATLFGTILAGGLILSLNFRKLGKEIEARKTLLYSVIATILMFIIAFLIPEDINIPNIVFTAIQLTVMTKIAQKLQANDINTHIKQGGAVASNWKAFGISLLVLLGVIAMIFVVIMILSVLEEN